MRPLFSALTAVAIALSAPALYAAQGDKDVYFQIWKDPAYHNYAQPAATYFGTMLNSGWYRTVAIERDFEWSIGMVLPWTIRAEADKTFEANGITLPTLVGDDDPILAAGSPVNPIHGAASMLFGLFLPTLEAELSAYYTSLDFRLMYLPTFTISRADYGIAWFGVGLRHDVSHYFAKNPLPVDIALAWHGTWWGLDYGERKDWVGEHFLDGFAQMGLLMIGKRFDQYELFAEIGWESSSMEASGKISKPSWGISEFETKGSVEGRNGFRMGINLSLHFGSTSGVGMHYGSQFGGWFRLFSIPKVTLHDEKKAVAAPQPRPAAEGDLELSDKYKEPLVNDSNEEEEQQSDLEQYDGEEMGKSLFD